MKVQDVRKECLATVGLTIEFSNSEIGTISSLLWNVTKSIEDGIARAHQFAATQEMMYKDNDDVPVTIDLKSLKRIEWLLVQMTRRDMSGLFEQADANYRADLSHINNIPAVKI